jgi:hypothetical protein
LKGKRNDIHKYYIIEKLIEINHEHQSCDQSYQMHDIGGKI